MDLRFQILRGWRSFPTVCSVFGSCSIMRKQIFPTHHFSRSASQHSILEVELHHALGDRAVLRSSGTMESGAEDQSMADEDSEVEAESSGEEAETTRERRSKSVGFKGRSPVPRNSSHAKRSSPKPPKSTSATKAKEKMHSLRRLIRHPRLLKPPRSALRRAHRLPARRY